MDENTINRTKAALNALIDIEQTLDREHTRL